MQTSNLKEEYENKLSKELQAELGLTNASATPKVTKVVVNMGIGAIAKDKEKMKIAITDMAAITGQKPAIRAAKTAIAGFSLRKGMPVGLVVTLRGKRMYDFLQRLFNVVLPRHRDFRGTKLASFDLQGNYTLGLSDYSVFPEIDLSQNVSVGGMEITIVTNTKEISTARSLLAKLGMPFAKEEK